MDRTDWLLVLLAIAAAVLFLSNLARPIESKIRPEPCDVEYVTRELPVACSDCPKTRDDYFVDRETTND